MFYVTPKSMLSKHHCGRCSSGSPQQELLKKRRQVSMGNLGEENNPLRLQRAWPWTGESRGQPFRGLDMGEKD